MRAAVDIRLIARLRPPMPAQTAVGLTEAQQAHGGTLTLIRNDRPAAVIVRASRPTGSDAA